MQELGHPVEGGLNQIYYRGGTYLSVEAEGEDMVPGLRVGYGSGVPGGIQSDPEQMGWGTPVGGGPSTISGVQGLIFAYIRYSGVPG